MNKQNMENKRIVERLSKHVLLWICILLNVIFISACTNQKTDYENDKQDEYAQGVKDRADEELRNQGYAVPADKAKDTTTSFMEDESTTPENSIPAPPGMVFKIGNDYEVFNGGTPPTFSIDKPYSVTELWTYHWNGGKGAPAGGTLSIVSSDGTTYGPWQVEVKNNVYWVATVNAVLPTGTYTVNDSEPGTLAQNQESGGQGHAWMYGSVTE